MQSCVCKGSGAALDPRIVFQPATNHIERLPNRLRQLSLRLMISDQFAPRNGQAYAYDKWSSPVMVMNRRSLDLYITVTYAIKIGI